MGLFAYIKNGVKYKMNQFPGAYPANRVSYNGSDVETALDELNADIAYNNIKNQSISLVANTLTDIIEFTVDHPVVLSVFYATTASTDKLEIFVYQNNSGSYTNIAGAVCNNLATVIPAGTFKVTLRCNTAQTSRPCIISYR